MFKVYIAGRLNDNAVGYIKNLHNMIQWAEKIRKLGCSVYVPGLDFLVGVVMGNYNYEDYFNNSQPWLDVSDAVFVIPNSDDSIGTKKEIARAQMMGIPVFHKTTDLIFTIKTGKY